MPGSCKLAVQVEGICLHRIHLHSAFFFAASCMAQRNSLSGRSPFCQLVEVKKGSSAMMISTSSAFKQQKPEETRDKPRGRKKTASQRVSEATA